MDAVAAAIRNALGPVLEVPSARICVALSGGLDSSVLLHAAARLDSGRLRAIYVNHQLHVDAAAWGRHCAGLCATLDVPFTALTVTVGSNTGEGPEAAARRARYGALAEALGDGEVLLTAHHRDDQAETLLLNLLRGAGPAGLAGIGSRTPLGRGEVRRPLLDLPRSALLDYARQSGLDWIEDPGNVDPRMDRNFLRHRILPALEGRWPGARTTLSRAARFSGEAARMIDELGALDARRVQRCGRILVPALRSLGESRQRNVVRHLCRLRLGAVPPEARLREGVAQLLGAAGDRQPLLAWPGGEIRRYRGELYLSRPLQPRPSAPDLPELPARPGARLELGGGLGRLRLARARGVGLATDKLAASLVVRFRGGGERLQPAGSTHRRELQEAAPGARRRALDARTHPPAVLGR